MKSVRHVKSEFFLLFTPLKRGAGPLLRIDGVDNKTVVVVGYHLNVISGRYDLVFKGQKIFHGGVLDSHEKCSATLFHRPDSSRHQIRSAPCDSLVTGGRGEINLPLPTRLDHRDQNLQRILAFRCFADLSCVRTSQTFDSDHNLRVNK